MTKRNLPLLPVRMSGLSDRLADRGGPLRDVRIEHPLFTPFREVPDALSSVRFLRYPRVDLVGSVDVLARFDDGLPAVLEQRIGEGRLVVLTDPDQARGNAGKKLLAALAETLNDRDGLAALDAFPAWRATSAAERARLVRRVGEIMEQRVYEIAAALALEVGKNRMESLGDVQETADLIYYSCDAMERNNGFIKEMGRDPLVGYESRNVSMLRPYGVWLVISPFNFPFALTGGLVVLVMRMLGEMAVAFPGVGGFYEYSRLALGDLAGFLTGWMYWYFWTIVIALEAVAGANLLAYWFPGLTPWACTTKSPTRCTSSGLWSASQVSATPVPEREFIEVGDDLHAECERLVALGATRVSDEIVDAGTRWIVMVDPERNEFCLVHH